MAQAHKLKSGSWNIRVRTKDDAQSFTAPTKAECEFLYAQYKAGLKKPKTGKTVRDCVAEYIELSRAVLKPKTLHGYEIVLQHGFPHLMDELVDNLDDKKAQNAINIECRRQAERNGVKAGPISPKTIRNEWGVISASLKLVANKEFAVRLPNTPKTISKLPEPEEIMLAFRGTEIELPVMLAMWCGLRAAEIYGLTYDSIQGDTLLINKTRVTIGGERILQYSAKTDTSIRQVYLPPYIKSLIPPCAGEPTDFIITMSHSQVYLRYKAICQKHGLNITFHRLRHEFASISLTKLNLDIRTVQDAGGWKTDNCVRRIYSEVFSETRKEADRKRSEYLNSMIHSDAHSDKS